MDNHDSATCIHTVCEAMGENADFCEVGIPHYCYSYRNNENHEYKGDLVLNLYLVTKCEVVVIYFPGT